MNSQYNINISHCQALAAIRNSRQTYLQSIEINSIKNSMANIEQKYTNYIVKNIENIDQNRAIIRIIDLLKLIEAKQYNISWGYLKNKQKNNLKIGIKLLSTYYNNQQLLSYFNTFKTIQKYSKKLKSAFKLNTILQCKIKKSAILAIKQFTHNQHFQNISSILFQEVDHHDQFTDLSKSQQSTDHYNQLIKQQKDKINLLEKQLNQKNKQIKQLREEVYNITEKSSQSNNRNNRVKRFQFNQNQQYSDIDQTKVQQQLISKFMREVFELRQKMDLARQLCQDLKFNKSLNNSQIMKINSIIKLLMPNDMIVGQVSNQTNLYNFKP